VDEQLGIHVIIQSSCSLNLTSALWGWAPSNETEGGQLDTAKFSSEKLGVTTWLSNC